MDLVTIGVTVVVLAITAFVFRRTLFGISVRAASEDFDAARLMGVRANRVISGAFAFAGLLAGIAAVLVLMRSPTAEPTLGGDYLVKAVVAAIIGGLGSFSRRGRRRPRPRARRGRCCAATCPTVHGTA